MEVRAHKFFIMIGEWRKYSLLLILIFINLCKALL